jgi:hypothetical protein
MYKFTGQLSSFKVIIIPVFSNLLVSSYSLYEISNYCNTTILLFSVLYSIGIYSSFIIGAYLSIRNNDWTYIKQSQSLISPLVTSLTLMGLMISKFIDEQCQIFFPDWVMTYLSVIQSICYFISMICLCCIIWNDSSGCSFILAYLIFFGVFALLILLLSPINIIISWVLYRNLVHPTSLITTIIYWFQIVLSIIIDVIIIISYVRAMNSDAATIPLMTEIEKHHHDDI